MHRGCQDRSPFAQHRREEVLQDWLDDGLYSLQPSVVSKNRADVKQFTQVRTHQIYRLDDSESTDLFGLQAWRRSLKILENIAIS